MGIEPTKILLFIFAVAAVFVLAWIVTILVRKHMDRKAVVAHIRRVRNSHSK